MRRKRGGGREERVRIAAFVPAGRMIMRVGIDARSPDVAIMRIVIEVVDELITVRVVHGSVGELVDLESAQHRMARWTVDDDLIARIGDRRVNEPEVEADRVDAAEAVE